MYRKIFIFVFFISVISFGQAIKPKITTQVVEHNFGSKTGSFTFILYNSGGGTLHIKKVKSTCSCVFTNLEKVDIPMADSSKLTVNFSGSDKKGPMLEHIYVHSNDITTPVLKLTVTSDKHIPPLIFPNLSKVDTGLKNRPEKSPIISIDKTSFDFGEVKKGNVVSHNFTIKNVGNQMLEIKRVRTSCGCTAALLNKNKLDPGEESTLHVEFDSSIEHGKVHRQIEILSNDPAKEKTILNIYVTVINGSK